MTYQRAKKKKKEKKRSEHFPMYQITWKTSRLNLQRQIFQGAFYDLTKRMQSFPSFRHNTLTELNENTTLFSP